MVVKMENALINREKLIKAVEIEIVGPSRIQENSKKFNEATVITVDEAKENYYWSYCGEKEEVLQTEFPSRRYSAGMLYPVQAKQEEIVSIDGLSPNEDEVEKVVINPELKPKELKQISNENLTTEGTKSISSNDFLPSSLGFTCRIAPEAKQLKVSFKGAHYKAHKVTIAEKKYSKSWWLRKTMIGEYTIDFESFPDNFQTNVPLPMYNLSKEEIENFDISLSIRCRIKENSKLITITITNRTSTMKRKGQADEAIVFQSEITAQVLNSLFLNYPKHYQRMLPMTPDETNDELLYRNKINYAFGHGCSTTWDQFSEEITEIKTTFVPTYETTSMTPDVTIIKDGKHTQLKIKMIDLANCKNYESLSKILEPLLNGYEQWIKDCEQEITGLPAVLQPAAQHNMNLAKESLHRMRRGLLHLQDETVRTTFILANKAILLQQVNGKKERVPETENLELHYDIGYSETVKLLPQLLESQNSWRPFQIAFFLMSIDSIVNNESIEREVVDLIWFPTGGGKTEAYLAVAAFQMFYRRITSPSDAGVDIMMRYTLRLLTADQFQRSSRLICAMEYLRSKEDVPLGLMPFSIGMWVGGTTSPNNHKNALAQLREMNNGVRQETFILNRCPWCGSTIGKIKAKNQKGKKNTSIHGYTNVENKLVTYCPDVDCHFHDEIPVYFVDETIYEKRPTFLIGTIDKFVQLTWNPQARSLFGIGKNGEQLYTPPNLIIQDELHLISGPLGTLAGLFEGLIEELCTKKVNGKYIRPKIISATATIKEFDEQARCLFAREKANLFPSPGLNIDDSFFAKIALDKDTMRPMPGRKYVGVFTSNVGLMMAEVQTFSAILQEAFLLPQDECDPYWTLLAFYNSLRDLGAGINLCNMDIPTYINSIKKRENYEQQRFIKEPLELTSRLQSHEISKTIDDLKKEFDVKAKNKPLDVCLASNIIEVGVDIDRLSVMAIVGQPKTTAQYIQVSGRVGRRTDERPGVIFTLYSNRNSRDKSHFEHFNEYHQRLYAQVETTSVTPFSDASLERGLSAVIIGYVRQRFSDLLAKTPNSEAFAEVEDSEEFTHFRQGLMKRLILVDKEQANVFIDTYEAICQKILSGDFNSWDIGNGVQGLMYKSGDPIAKNNSPKSIGVINTLRSVDAESKGEISLNVTSKTLVPKTPKDWGLFNI
ncbi:helicase-related protein [Paenisporosarcina quisquiliarum]|uniref:helicase-related protein n=1 Tax=Paenisporosarcina quisquiliarum TaxID=365346 RepID=UPI0037369138